MPLSPDVLQGQVYKGYKFESEIGRGGFAWVYRARVINDNNREIAIKVFERGVPPAEMQRFMNEAYWLSQFNHQRIVPYEGSDLDKNSELQYIAMGYAENKTLKNQLDKRGVFPVAETLKYIRQAAEGLQYMHDEHVIHRDVKPDNMLLNGHFDIMLTDLGIAILAHKVPTPEAHGTLGYTAPEQLRKNPVFASDQFALAASAYELLCGKLPFSSIQDTLNGQPIPMKNQVQKFTMLLAEMEKNMLQAMENDPDKRFATVLDFANALQKTFDDVSSGKQPLPGHQFPVAKPNIPHPQPPVPPQPNKPPAPIVQKPVQPQQNPINIQPAPVIPPLPGGGRGQQAIHLPQPRPNPNILQSILQGGQNMRVTRRQVLIGTAGLAVAGIGGYELYNYISYRAPSPNLETLYQENGSDNWAGWNGIPSRDSSNNTLMPDWKIVNHTLIYDNNIDTDGILNDTSDPYCEIYEPTIIAPYQIDATQFAVELKAQATSGGFFNISLSAFYDQIWEIYAISKNSIEVGAKGGVGFITQKTIQLQFDPSYFHTYRVEVKDNHSKLFLDGDFITDYDTDTLTGKVGLGSNSSQVKISKFSIYAI